MIIDIATKTKIVKSVHTECQVDTQKPNKLNLGAVDKTINNWRLTPL